jgi:hypothetical protein
MATIAAVLVDKGAGYRLWKWETLTATNNEGSAVDVRKYRDKTVQIIGTLGAGSVTIEGSIDNGTTWATLNDPQGNALATINALKIEAILEGVTHIRPTVAAGTTDVDVWLLVA